MSLQEIMSTVTAVTLVLMACCLLPVLIELRKTALSLRGIAESLQVEIKPLIEELRDTVADVQVVTRSAAANVDGVNLFLAELGTAGQNIRMVNKVIGVASELAVTSSAWFTGVRVAGKFLADKLIKKRR
jgi:hypothetical protein